MKAQVRNLERQVDLTRGRRLEKPNQALNIEMLFALIVSLLVPEYQQRRGNQNPPFLEGFPSTVIGTTPTSSTGLIAQELQNNNEAEQHAEEERKSPAEAPFGDKTPDSEFIYY